MNAVIPLEHYSSKAARHAPLPAGIAASRSDDKPLEVYDGGGGRSLYHTVFQSGRSVMVWRNGRGANKGYWELGWTIRGVDDHGAIVVARGNLTKNHDARLLLSVNPHLLPADMQVNVPRRFGDEAGWKMSGFNERENLFQMRRDGSKKAVSLDQLLEKNPGLLPPSTGPRPAVPAELQAPKDMIRGFKQGQEGNCASVAVIKAAMKTFGADVFQQVKKYPGGRYEITMQDGRKVSLSADEIARTARSSHFEGNFKSYPVLCYAAMAKRKLDSAGSGIMTFEPVNGQWSFDASGAPRGRWVMRPPSFENAIYSLNHGHDPQVCANLLGLGDRVKKIPVNHIPAGLSAVVWSRRHTVYVEGSYAGPVYDKWGEGRPYHGTVMGPKAEEAFYFAPRS